MYYYEVLSRSNKQNLEISINMKHSLSPNIGIKSSNTMKTPSIGTDRCEQTVLTQVRLLSLGAV